MVLDLVCRHTHAHVVSRLSVHVLLSICRKISTYTHDPRFTYAARNAFTAVRTYVRARLHHRLSLFRYSIKKVDLDLLF